MDNMNYENKILDAVQLLVDSAISKAKYDKTIQGIIVKCTDETKGQYVVSYQNSSFYAYSTDTSSIFNAGTAVYVLIPESDMSQTKTILGSVNKLGTDYINIIDVSNDFQIIGNSVVTSEDEIGVRSLLSGGDNVVLYDKDDIEHALVDVNTIAADTYFKETNYLVLGADFRTNLPNNQKYQGDYGLIAELVFKDNITENEVTRTYVLNLNDMEGMPYNFSNPTSQKLIFEIDGQNFVEVKKLQFYCINFPHSQANPAEDIFISNIRLEGANRLEGAELEGNSLTFVTPAGIYFDDNDSSTAEREVNAVLRVDGKIVTADSAEVSYYWFKENCLINTASANYNRYGGTGWECLNDYNTVTTNVKEWISGKSQYITKKQDNIAQETTYKCVVIYNGFVLSRTFNIYNYSSDYDVQIASDIGTYFMCDNGRPTLTCSVNGSTTENYTYAWGMINNNGKYSTIAETTELNTTYHTTKNRYDQLVNGLEDGSILLTDDIQTELNTKKLALQEFATTMRVEGGVIYNLTLNLIVSFSYITCFVYNNGVYIGKSKILITNDLKVGTSPYSLVINNGDQVFKYNEQGISPASPALENPQKIFPLTFSLYDEQGKEIDQAAISATNVFWTLPTTDTMIEIVGAGSSHSEDNVNNTITYFGSKTLVFKIPTLYQIDKTRNNIQLLVKYKDKIAVAKTDLSFIKEGETGSNGTNYICRLVPNLAIGSQVPVYPIYRYNNTTQTGSLNYTSATVGRWFKAELFKDGVSIFSSATSGNSTEGKAVTLKWEILKNKYTSSVSDSSNFAINSNGEFSFASNNVSNPANIIKCTITYDGQTYYSTMPLMFVDADAAFKVDLVENTGFLSAMYTADGQRPSYNNAKPFKLKVIENISGTDTDISIATGARAITYTWSAKGSVYDGSTFITSTNLIEKTIVGETLAINEKRYQPVDSFDGLCVSNSLLCEIKQKNENNTLVTKAKIYIPIHLYLNKYGNAAMNGWDGNSIEIDNDGGFILAPQVGAGKKEQDNSYTGIFMGDVREAGAANNEVGLFGYKSGVRTLELNAEDGSAKFGKTGAGQIVIAPGEGANKGTAKLYSSDYEVSYVAPENMVPAQTVYLGGYSYWKRVDTNYYLMKVVDDSCVDGYYYNGAFYRESAHTNIITPQINRQYHDLSTRKCYIYKNSAYSELPYYYKIGDIIAASVYVWFGGTGLEIDLNDPHIRFGSGKFRVDSDGQVYATGFVSVVDLEQGKYDIPGTEKFKVEYATEAVQFETDADHKPLSTITKNIVCKCYYKEEITSNYTAVLVDSNGNTITHNNDDGLGLTITKSGTDTTIAFTATSGTTIPNAINEYFIKFTYTPQADLNTTKAFYANLVIQGQDGQPGEQGPAGPPGKDGTSVTVKGSYDTLEELIQAHPSGNTLGDAYVIGQNLYVYTNAAGGSGASPGDWNNVGQFKGDDAKSCFVVASTDVFKSVNGGTTFTPTSITITPLLQTVQVQNWAYSINGGSNWTTLTGSEPGITINQNNTLVVENSFSGFNSSSSVVFKCTSDGFDDNNNPIADTIAITKLQDGMNGNGITSIVNHYLATSANSGVTINTPGWNTDPSTQILTETNKYLWNYETISYDRGNPLNTTPTIIGHYGKDGTNGNNGRGIASITEYYATGTSPTEPPSQSSFDTQVVAPTADKPYLWNYEVVTYTDDNSESTDKRVIGTYGEKGDAGNDAYTVVLSNESHTFAATDSYAVGETITITPYVYKGATSRTDYNISNITGGISGKLIITKSQTQPYTLSIEATNQLNTQNGIISFDITIDGKTFTKAFSWALAKAGTNGKSPTAYNLIVSHAAVIKNPDGSYNPSSIILTAKSQTGNSAIQNFTSGRYAIFLNGSSTATATPASSAGYSYTIPANTNSIRIALYNSSTGTIILDEQTVSIVTDGSNGFSIWTTTTAPDTNHKISISNLTGPTGVTPRVGEHVLRSNRYQSTISAVSSTEVTVGTETDLKGTAGNDAYTVILDNESHTFAATTSAATGETIVVTPYVYKGATKRTDYTIGSISGTVTGLEATVSTNTPKTVSIKATTSLTTGSGVLTIPVTIDNKTFNKQFSWSLAKAGNGINSVTNYYLATSANSGVTRETTGWKTTIQTMTETNKYLWTYEDTLYTNRTHGYTDPSIIGVYGTHGTGISSIVEYYAISDSSTTAPADSEFDTNVKVPTAAKPYLWNYEKINYTNPTSSVNTTKHVVGNYAADGTSPTAYSLIVSHAAIVKTKSGTYSPTSVTFSATSQTGSGAVTTYTGGSYRITKDSGTAGSWTNLSSSNNYNVTSGAPTTSVKIELAKENASSSTHTIVDTQTLPIVTDGTDGTDGKSVSVSSTSLQYANSTNGTAHPSSGWTNSPSPVAGQYLWTKTVISYVYTGTSTSAGSSTSYNVAYVGKNGTDGSPGKGISAITQYYGLSTSESTEPTSYDTEVQVPTASLPFLWNYEIITYINPSGTTETEHHVIGHYGKDGINGTSPYIAYLTNEAQTFMYGTAKDITTQLYAYQGTAEKTVTIKTVNGVTASTSSTATGKTGMNFKVSSTSAVSHPTITFSATTSLAQSQTEQLAIVYRITGDNADKTVYFSYASTTRGAAAVAYEVEPSVYSIVKKVDGTFAPASITFYGYSKTGSSARAAYSGRWLIQTSTNGSSWTTVYTGSSNESSHSYTISGSIKLVKAYLGPAGSTPTTSNALDSQSVSILNDTVDILVGGRNLLLQTSGEKTFDASTSDLYNLSAYAKNRIKATDKLTLSFDAKASTGLWIDFYWRDASSTYASTSYFYPAFQLTTSYQHFEYTGVSGLALTNILGLRIRQSSSSHGGASAVGTVYINNIKLENSNLATDWTMAPEDSAVSTAITYTTTTTSATPDSSAIWGLTIDNPSNLYIWQRIEYQFEDVSQNYNTDPVCIYAPTKITSKLQYCLRSSMTYTEGSLISAWQDSPFAWQDNSDYYTGTISLNTTTHQYVTSITIKRFQFIRTAYFDTNTNTWSYSDEEPYNQAPILDESWKMEGEISASKALIQQELTTTTNNNIFTLDANDGITVENANKTYGIRLTSLGIQFKLNNQWTTVWNIDGTLDANNITVNNVNAESIISGKLTLYKNKNNGEFVYDGGNSSYTYINQSGTKVIDKQGNTVHIKAEGETINGSEQKIGGISAKTSSNAEYFSIAPDTKTTTMDNANVQNDLDFNTNVKIVHITNGIAFISKG